MEGDFCRIRPPKVKNRETGVEEEPILYDSLYQQFGKNRDKAVAYYFKYTTPTFMNHFKDAIRLNVQGQPTLDSLMEIPYVQRELNLSEDKILDNLNKSIGAGIYTSAEAMEKAKKFADDQTYSKKYIPMLTTITQGEDAGKVFFSIVKKDAETFANYKNYVTQVTYKNRIIKLLNEMGVDASFVDELVEEANANGVYDTRSPQKTMENLYTLIYIATEGKTDRQLTQTLCHEVGHLITALAENSNNKELQSFYGRIKAYADNYLSNLQDDIRELESQYDIASEDMLGTDTTREYIGRYIGDMLFQLGESGLSSNTRFENIGKDRYLSTLISRLWNSLKALLHNIMATVYNSFYAHNNFDKVLNPDGTYKLGSDGKPLLQEKPMMDIKHWYDYSIRRDVENDVKRLINAFMDGQYDVEDALKTPELKRSDSIMAVSEVNAILRSLNSFIMDYSDLGGHKLDIQKLMDYLRDAGEEKSKYDTTGNKKLIEMTCLSSLDSLMDNLIDFANDVIRADLLAVDPNFIDEVRHSKMEKLNNIEKLDANIKVILAARSFLDTYTVINDILDKFKDNYRDIWYSHPDIENTYNRFSNLMTQNGENVERLIKKVSADVDEAILTTTNGGEAIINREKRLIKDSFTGKYKFAEEHKSISELLTSYEYEDMSFFERHIYPIYKSPDVISQLHAKLVDYNMYQQNEQLLGLKRNMLDFYYDMQEKLGSDSFEWMMEKYDADVLEDGEITHKKGDFTGNIRQRLKWGMWEAQMDYDLKKNLERVKEEKKDELAAMNSFDKDKFLKEEQHKFILNWHADHSVHVEHPSKKNPDVAADPDVSNYLYSAENEDHVFGRNIYFKPNESYADESWNSVPQNQKDLINRYIQIKYGLDKMVNDYRHGAATRFYRLPQFRGAFFDRVRHQNVNILKSPLSVVQKQMTETFYANALDTDFGDLSCYTNETQTTDLEISSRFSEWRRKLPVYGISKIDSQDLSTDLVSSTMAYAVMATGINALHTTALALQLGEIVLGERTVKSQAERKDKLVHSGVYNRYRRYLDMNVFHKYQTKTAFKEFIMRDSEKTASTKRLIGSKVMKFLNSSLSTFILSGRIPGATVNTMTGLVQIMREASVREHFTEGELWDALATYFGGVISGIGEQSKEGLMRNLMNDKFDRQNKVYSFIALADAQNKNMQHFQEMNVRVNPILRAQWGLWVYEWGDHFMQTVPYIAKAKHKQLYTVDDDMLDTKLEDIEESDLKNAGSVWKNFDEKELNKSEIDKTLSRDPYHTATRRLFIKTNDGQIKEWNSIEQAAFYSECRQLVNDMHGVYNMRDTAGASQNPVINTIFTMRKYYIGYMMSLWGNQRYSVERRTETQGAFDAVKTLLGWRIQQKGKLRTAFSREVMMGIPVAVTSLCTVAQIGVNALGFDSGILSAIGSSSFVPILAYMCHDIISTSIFGSKFKGLDKIFGKYYRSELKEGDKSSYARTEYLDKEDHLHQTQVDALRRADTNVKAYMLLQIITKMFACGFFKLPADEDDKEYDDYDIDASIMKLFGVEDYDEIRNELAKTSTSNGKDYIKYNGVAYNMIMNWVNQDKEHRYRYYQAMGMLFYVTRRLAAEQATISPLVLADTDEARTQASELGRYTPVYISYMAQIIQDLKEISEDAGVANFKYNKDILEDGHNIFTQEGREDIEEMYNDYDNGDFFGFDVDGYHIGIPIGQTMGTFMLSLPGAAHNKGLRKLYFTLPYLNSTKFFMDAYKSSDSWMSGRTMGG